MADLASKRAEADFLRAELAALRTARENGAQAGHMVIQEAALDEEVERLRREVERERASVSALGSVEDATSIMEAAARENGEAVPGVEVDGNEAAEVNTSDAVSAEDGVVTEAAQPADSPIIVAPLLGDAANTDEVK